MNILTATLKALKFPLKLLSKLVRSKRKKPLKSKLEQKQRKYAWNFDPTRLKNRSWQKNFLKKPKKRGKKSKKFVKSFNSKNYEAKQQK